MGGGADASNLKPVEGFMKLPQFRVPKNEKKSYSTGW